MRKKKSIISFSAVLIVTFVATWYFILKPWDYKLYFSLKSHPSVVYTGIKDWDEWNGKKMPKGNVFCRNEEPWEKLTKTLLLNDTTLHFYWHLIQKNDSVTRVVVGVSDGKRKVRNRIGIMFSSSAFERSVKKNMLILKQKLSELTNSFDYKYIGPDSLEEKTCVYISTKSTVRGKANEMIKNVVRLNLFVKDNNLELNGDPFVIVNEWAPDSDSIQFDFCFPVLHPGLMPDTEGIRLKTISVKNALKGEFYGNYSLSDMAWHLLLDQAKTNEQNNTGRIVEVFYNDPHSGGDELSWKAGVYLELEDSRH